MTSKKVDWEQEIRKEETVKKVVNYVEQHGREVKASGKLEAVFYDNIKPSYKRGRVGFRFM